MKTHRIAPLPKTWIRRLLADEEGAATTETVIMIPMFVIVWGCIVYVTQVFQATIEMRSRIRRDTWAYAYNSCEDMPDTGTNLSVSPGFIPDSTGAGSEAEGAASGGGALRISSWQYPRASGPRPRRTPAHVLPASELGSRRKAPPAASISSSACTCDKVASPLPCSTSMRASRSCPRWPSAGKPWPPPTIAPLCAC